MDKYTIRAIRNLKKRTTNGGSRWSAVVRGGSRWLAEVCKLDNIYFFILDNCFQYIPKRNVIKNMIESKY